MSQPDLDIPLGSETPSLEKLSNFLFSHVTHQLNSPDGENVATIYHSSSISCSLALKNQPIGFLLQESDPLFD